MNGYNLYVIYSFKKNMAILWFFPWIWCMVTWFIWVIKPRFVLCKNANLGVYCEARFDDLMLWRVPLIRLQSVFEELFWGVLAWSNRASFFVDFKRRWRRLENSLRELPCLKRERERARASLLAELVLKKIFYLPDPLPLGWGPLFIEIYRGS